MITLRQRPDFDVAIAGAGPAGAAAAAHLAGTGYVVALLDQKTFPRDKVCGDFVGPAAIAELDQLGVTDRPEFWQTNEIRQAALYLDGEDLIIQDFPQVDGLPDYGRVIPRIDLDHWIVQAATGAGAELIENHHVTGYEIHGDLVHVRARTGAGTRVLTARLLIGADGSSSVIARQLAGRLQDDEHRIIAVRAYYEGVDEVPDRAELYFTSGSFPGYYWLFPTGADTANVGVGLALGTVPENQTHLRDLLVERVERDPILYQRLGRARIVGKIVGWPLATYDPDLPLFGDRVMLAGDAAGLINPLNGEGIQTALSSGRWASEVAIPCLANDDLSARALAPYQRQVEDELRHDMALACFLIQIIRNRALTPIWLEALRVICHRARRDEIYARTAGSILAGIAPARDALGLRMILGSMHEAALTLGMEGVSALLHAAQGNPGALARMGMAAARMGLQLAYDAITDPRDMSRWIGSTAQLAAELATQSLRSSAR
jgi:geranylgeranyl reductase family protein